MSLEPAAVNYQDALRRLCVRCPAAQEEPLLQQALSDEPSTARAALLPALKTLLVDPNCTLAVATICRPVLLGVVAALVEEAPCAATAVALVRVMAVAPHTELEALRYFSAAPGPFAYLDEDTVPAVDLARCTLWGLQRSVDLRALWRWPALLPLLSHPDPDVKWAGAQAVALALSGGDALTATLTRRLLAPDAAADAALRWQNACAALAVEAAAMFCDPGAPPAPAAPKKQQRSAGRKRKQLEEPTHHGWPLAPPPKYAQICGLDLARRGPGGGAAAPPPAHALIPTPSMQRNLEAAVLGLAAGAPLLLEGPPSSGKSALVAHLAEVTGNAGDMVHVHLDDQTDSKTLLGAYVCAAKPGEFVWQPGLLTQAVTKGCWVVVEDINLASPEVLATLLPLVERRQLHVPSRGEELAAARGFQLIATVTSDPGAMGAGVYGSAAAVKDLLGAHFHCVRMEPAAEEEQADIVAALHPAVAPLVPHTMASVALVQVATRQRAQGEAAGARIAQALAAAGLRPGEAALGRYFSFRDVLKWARRMEAQHKALLARSLRAAGADYGGAVAEVPIALREAAFVEAADCLCAGLADHDAADRLLAALAAIWAVPPSAAEHYSQLAKPAAAVRGGELSVGRAALPLLAADGAARGASRFAQTGHAMRHMERVAVAAAGGEPVLLVGETGTGKTTLVQEIASQVRAKLVVVNLSQQTDSSDLIGGFRPLQPADAVVGLLPGFVDMVRRTWTRGNNDEFLDRVVKMAAKRRWRQLVKAFRTAVAKTGVAPPVAGGEGPSAAQTGSKKSKKGGSSLEPPLQAEWEAFVGRLDAAESTAAAAEGGFAFGFFEGALLQAVREGWWLLLDEINLAPAEALERISGLLEEDDAGITVAERGDVDAVAKHPNFRLFAAMNPATDAGKRDLPGPLRNRFTEIWVGEPRHRDDLAAIVAGHLLPVSMGAPVNDVVDFYLAVKEAADTVLQDGAGHKPTYNLRTLSRALEYAARASAVYGLQRALYDGFAMSFLTQLDPGSTATMERLMQQHLVGKGTSLKALMNSSPAAPSDTCVLFDHYWVEVGDAPVAETREDDGKGGVFVATPTVTQHLRNLARAVLLRKYPILLQGPTSSGKTSLVAYLAAQTGHHFVRINNHEQTDLQEYLGTYVSDEHGRLVFQEGLLVQAVRHGHWIVLDELNLAPTEVLEALNRLLDDNRELFVPELQEVVKPHPHFMLFATQNPPGLYAGRKTLSRAFRSRFLELHVEDIPDEEMHVILEKRCAIAPSYAAKLVAVMRELQRRRALSNVFAGRHGFITPRDLFRWAGRGAVGYQQLAEDGFAVLGERLRSDDERTTVAEVLQKLLNTKIDMQALYDGVEMPQMSEDEASASGVGRLVWTETFRRMYWLLDRCLRTSEPALLVGETGLGKTTVCQLAAYARGQNLRIINCNQHTETSDFLGGYRPNRSRDAALSSFREAVGAFNAVAQRAGLQLLDDSASASIADLQEKVSAARDVASTASGKAAGKLTAHAQAMESHLAKYRAPFEWVDGPLILAMKLGDVLLIDELNLAEDAVLERLNSVLEASRSVTLAEKGGKGAEVIVAHPNFRIIATMNPGGDYGKKELSPALSNRFTSIWVPPMDDEAELRSILQARLTVPELQQLITPLLLDFWAYYRGRIAPAARQVLSVRDLLTWIDFINSTYSGMGPYISFAHGAHVAFLDGIGLGVGLSEEASIALRSKCINFLVSQLPAEVKEEVEAALSLRDSVPSVVQTESSWGLTPFFLERSNFSTAKGAPFDFNAPTTAKNAFRVLRAMQLRKPILLEGSPGVGKTSLIAAVSKALGRGFVRINLSEQTDMMDLLGADLPVEGGGPGEFAWSDGPLLQAIKSGAWVLLDELNLANQTVLEGLNALLDHRAEVFIPELGAKFKCAKGFRIFGAQNPLQEGGGRKGLPKSFLNRFSRVHVELLQRSDLLFIAGVLYPAVPRTLLGHMVEFLNVLDVDARVARVFAAVGGPWEFNLRDLLRWCELIARDGDGHGQDMQEKARHYAHMLFVSRMRTAEDRAHVMTVLDKFLTGSIAKESPVRLDPATVELGWARLPRHKFTGVTLEDYALLPAMAPLLESVAECISLNWMCLLVGPSGSGKTAAVRTLAQLCGKALLELPLNNGTDTSDLLGGFEQVDMVRKRHLLASSVDAVFSSLMANVLASSYDDASRVGQAAELWKELRAASTSPSDTASAATSVMEQVKDLLTSIADEDALQERLARAEALAAIILDSGDDMDGRFEWVDGSLTRAITEGRWVVLDNANLCNPSVLDRLNPLLEPHGVLYLNECGTGTRGPRVISPHPDFRLFLTFDPKHGEVSRAMRNRGLELFLIPDRVSGLGEEFDSGTSKEDLQAIAGFQGVPGDSLPSLMVKVHGAVRDQSLARHRRPPALRELTRWATMFKNLSSRGMSADVAIQKAFVAVYVQPCDGLYLRDAAQQAFSAVAASQGQELWFQPAVWPLPLTVSAFAAGSEVCSVLRDLSPLLQWAGSLGSGPPASSLALGAVTDAAFVLTALVPGQTLGRLLLGAVGDFEQAVASGIPGKARVAANFDAAALVYMERGAGGDLHQLWASKLLTQCGEVLSALSGGAVSVVYGGDVASQLAGAVQSLSAYFSNPLAVQDPASPMLPYLRRAIAVAVALQRTSAQASSGMHEARRTLLQLSCWRFDNPGSRSKLPAPNPAIDWLWPFFTAAQSCEEAVLGQAGPVAWGPAIADKLHIFQDERWALMYAVQYDAAAAGPDALGAHLETFVYIWMRLRSAVEELLALLPDSQEAGRLRQSAAQMDAALGLAAGLPPAPRLWERGGRPALAKTLQEVDAANEMLFLSGALAVSATGYPAAHPVVAAAVAGRAEREAEAMDGIDPDAVDVAIEVSARLAVNLVLRRELLEGMSLAEVGLHLEAGGAAAEGVAAALGAAFAREAAAAAAAWTEPGTCAAIFNGAAGTDVRATRALILPPAAMAHAAGREMQRQLLAWADLGCSKQQLAVQAGQASMVLALLREGASAGSLDAGELASVAAAVGASGCRDVAEGVPYNVLLWLRDAEQGGSGALRDASPEWRQALQQALAHEAWARWHRGLWTGAASAAPGFGPRSPLEAATWWQAIPGPMRLHISSLTAHALAVTASPRVPIRDRSLKLLQLQLAGRHLRAAQAKLSHAEIVAAEVRAALAVAAVTLEAHLPDLPAAPDVAAALRGLGDGGSDVLELLDNAVQGCEHRILREVWPQTLRVALQILLTPAAAAADTTGMAARGQAWALLGLARLALVAPPPGTDPAATFDLSRAHILRLVAWQIDPELQVRHQYAALPGGPSERAAIAALAERKTLLEEAAAELEGRSPPRPTPPQYLSLQEDIARFVSGLAALPRMVEMVGGVAAGATAALLEAKSWLDSAGGVASRLGAQYPAYRDIVQPVQLAINELRYGLALGVGAAEVAARGDVSLLEGAVGRLLRFPRATQDAGAMALESPALQQLVAGASGQTAKARAAAHGAADADAAGHAAGMVSRINLLRAALEEARGEWRRGPTPAARSAAAARLHAVFAEFLRVWEDIKEEEARRAAEEAELFKSKVRSVGVANEEEEAEEEFNRLFPDQFGAFEDLADADDLAMDEADGIRPQGALPEDAAAAAAAAAAFSAKNYFLGDILQEVVAAHAEVFAGAEAQGPAGTAAFLRSYELGMALVESAGGCLPARLDDVAATGHLYAAAARAQVLGAPSAAGDLGAEGGDADIHCPRPEEAVLVQEPVQGVRVRLAVLLEEWPDHPVLMQLDAIADRVLAMPVSSPLKALLTGLELLLARAQVWEETAAKHVSITAELKAVAALATRWRRLELTGWRALMTRAVERAAAGASAGWFHLYRILTAEDTGSVAQVAVAVELFVQGAPLGEYAARLALLEAFRGQVQALAAPGDRNAALAAVLRNVSRYYAQFVPAVEAAAAAGLAPSEKDLRDFVALAKWEDRGYYAMKASTEKAQRHLHKLCRRAAEALKQPCAGVLSAAAKGMGLDDLPAPEKVGPPPAAGPKGKAKKQQGPEGPAVVAILVDTAAAAAALGAAAAAAGPAPPLPEIAVAGKYSSQLPELAGRFEKVLRRGLGEGSGPASAGAASLAADEMASTVAERAVALRGDVAKGARARKKKALVDLFRALAAAGVSKLRSAVPANRRGMQAWFAQAVPEMEQLLRAGGGGDQAAAAGAAWAKSDAFYYASMARLQRLQEVANYPHADLSPAEINAACRSAEHLLYLTQAGREALGRAADQFARLDRLLAVIEAPDWHRDLPAQAAASARCRAAQETLTALATLADETRELLRAAAALEPAAEERQGLSQAGVAAGEAHSRLQQAASRLDTAVAGAATLPSGHLFVTASTLEAVAAGEALVQELAAELRQQAQHAEQPGWAALVAALEGAAAERPPAAVPAAPAAGDLLQTLAAEVEAMVQAQLLWAQATLDSGEAAAAEGDADGEEPPPPKFPAVLDAAVKRLGAGNLSKLVEHATAALSCLAALADAGDGGGVASGAALLCAAAPMLRVLRAGAWQSAARCLALHRSLSKLTYIACALFAGLVEQGFCMPEGGEGEAVEGDDTKVAEGTGLGEGDTTGAKDISDELEDQDQLLGAQQKGAEPPEPPPEAQQPEGGEGPKGVEMEDDFEGALEDVAPDEGGEEDDAGEEEGEEERLDQQMGDVGDAGEDVDERLWGGEDEEDGGKDREEGGHDQDNTVKVEDASKLDYAQGQEREEGAQGDKPPTEAPQQADKEEKQAQEAGEEEEAPGEGEEEDLGDYQDRPEDRGHVRPEAPDEEMELPEDLNLDGGEEGDEEEGGEEGGAEDQEEVVREEGGAFPEQAPAPEEGGEEERQAGDGAEPEEGEGAPEEGPQPAGAPGAEIEEGGEEGGEEEGDEPMATVPEEEPPQPAPEEAQADAERGAAAAVAAAAGTDAGAADQAEEMEVDEGDAAAGLDGAPEPPQAATGSAAGAAGGMQDDAAAAQMSGRGADQRQQQRQAQQPLAESNPYRNLGSALERWRARLAMAADAPEQGPQDPEAAGVQEEQEEGGGGGDDAGDDGEYRFLGKDEAAAAGDTQALAGATEEQAGVQAGEEEVSGGGGGGAMEDIEEEQGAEDMAVDEAAPPPASMAQGQAAWGAGGGEKAGLEQQQQQREAEPAADDGGDGKGEDAEEEEAEEQAAADALVDGVVASKLRATHLEEEEALEALLEPLSGERAEALRAELDRRLRATSEGTLGEGDLGHGRDVWTRCEALTAGLVGELAEQLRLILEPTLASKLGGEYRTGKRINMKRVIGYIASHFRKDKIWMRRTRPDKRRYQVLVAVDDSRSMAETGCGGFALEALTLICKAMARLDVGELGVVSFGGGGGAVPLHPLDRPFTDADGVRVMSHLRFDQDNTIGDRPMVDVVTSVDHLLAGAAARAAAGPAAHGSSLHQLVLVIADGRFHEKEALRRAARDAAARPGVLYAFIVLDNPANSILDMQSVAFSAGKPVFTKYMDSFPFPFYIVLRDTAALPRTLADLLRQWFELQQR